MARQYPSTFACPLISGYTVTAAAGVIRSDMPAHQAQRRVFNTMPHTVNLSFAMTVTDWGDWENWVTLYGYHWFEMSLPSMYASKPVNGGSPTLIRFTSNLQVVALTQTHVQISVTAEFAPSMTKLQLV